MKYNITFNDCVDIILCKLTYEYIQRLGFDYYWVINNEDQKIKHLYPLFSEDNIYGILKQNHSSLISTNDVTLLESLDELEYIFILHLPEHTNEYHKVKSP